MVYWCCIGSITATRILQVCNVYMYNKEKQPHDPHLYFPPDTHLSKEKVTGADYRLAAIHILALLRGKAASNVTMQVGELPRDPGSFYIF